MGSVHSQGGVDASWRKMKFRKWPTTNKEKAATTHSPVRTDDKKRHPKLDMLHILSQGQNLNRSYTTDEFGVDNLGQVLHMLPAYDGTPWGLEWLPPTRVPSRIADQFVAIACQEIFQVSIFRVAGFVLGQVDCHPLGGLLDRVCYIRDKLQALQVASDWKNIFIEVEEILRLKQPQLAHWVVASSLSNPQYPLHDALKPITDPVKELLATKTLKLRQQQLKNYEQFISGYNWTLATNVPKI